MYQEGAIKEARFLHPGSAKMEVSSRASGENTASGVQLGGRDLHKGQHCLLPSPRLYPPMQSRLGAEAHTSGNQTQERARVGCGETA